MFTRILVATDFSGPSDAALEYARAFATKFGSTLHLLHVMEMAFATGPLSSEQFIAETPAVQAELFEDARARMAHRVTPADRARFKITTEITVGTSAQTIIDCANARGIDLIVVGTHGRTGMAHLLMGSVAERVVRTAQCPVLTVRQAPAAHELPYRAAALAMASC